MHGFRLKVEQSPVCRFCFWPGTELPVSGQLLPLVFIPGVVVGAVKQACHISVLHNGAGLEQIGHAGNARATARARLRPPVQLDRNGGRNLEFPGQGLEARGYFRHFPFLAVGRLPERGAHQLQVIHANDGQSSEGLPVLRKDTCGMFAEVSQTEQNDPYNFLKLPLTGLLGAASSATLLFRRKKRTHVQGISSFFK